MTSDKTCHAGRAPVERRVGHRTFNKENSVDANIILITCAIVMVINTFFAYRNSWVYDRRIELNRFENGTYVIQLYLDYTEMMNKWWVWDIEKLKVSNDGGKPQPAADKTL